MALLSAASHSAPDLLSRAAQLLSSARSIAVLTGAGISAESGLPTFRGPGGLWRNYPGWKLATPEAFAADPKLVWEWYDYRRSIIAAAQPNPGHLALVELERRAPNFLLATQNVDGLHERAGNSKILRLHGSIWRMRCTACHREDLDTRVPLAPLPPLCDCGAMLRPGVVWFGESLPADALHSALDFARRADLVLVLGTSSVVYPAAAIPLVAIESGARVIEINLEPTELSPRADFSFRAKTGELLPTLLSLLP